MEFIKTHFHRILVILGISIGMYNAFTLSWVSDDAYISFIYARNFNEGLGLVFQAGERVEGMSNFIWTILLSLSYILGIRIEDFSTFMGILFYFLTLVSFSNPYLLISYSLFPFGWEFATGGLETSLYTFWILFSYKMYKKEKWWELILLSAIFPLIRPDGALFSVGNLILFLLGSNWKDKKFWMNRKAILILVLSFLVLAVFIGKCLYYGNMLPNTYYAKAGMGSYFSRGFIYFFYFYKEFIVFSVFLSVGIVFSRCNYSWIAISYLVYVLYVGGDFMFARFIVPIIPLAMILTWERLKLAEDSWKEKFGIKGKKFSRIVFLLFLLSPVLQTRGYTLHAWDVYKEYGISHERLIYKNLGSESLEYDSSIFQSFSVAFGGAQSHFIYYMRPGYAIESTTGLTDSFLANRPIETRGKVGHEKQAPLEYLREKKVNLVLFDGYPELSEKERNLYYNWNGNRLLWKVLYLDPAQLTLLKNHPNFDTSELDPSIWETK